MEEIKADEAKNGYIRVYDRAVLVNDSYGYQPSLESVTFYTKHYSDIPDEKMRYEYDEDFAGFWAKFKRMYMCPDTWTDNGKTVLTYKMMNDEGYLSIVPEEGLVTYIKNNDPDNCEIIMKDKGCVSAEDMANLKELRNLIVSMTD